jgi:hypothetical protein
MGGLRVAVGIIKGKLYSSSRNNKRKAVENRKRLVRAYVDIGAGAGRRIGALVRSLVSPRKPPSRL